MSEGFILLSILGSFTYLVSELLYYATFEEMWVYTLYNKIFNLLNSLYNYILNQETSLIKPSKKIEEYLDNLTDLVDIKIYRDELSDISQNINQAKRRAYDKIIKRNEKKKAQEIIDSLDIKMSVLKELKGDK